MNTEWSLGRPWGLVAVPELHLLTRCEPAKPNKAAGSGSWVQPWDFKQPLAVRVNVIKPRFKRVPSNRILFKGAVRLKMKFHPFVTLYCVNGGSGFLIHVTVSQCQKIPPHGLQRKTPTERPSVRKRQPSDPSQNNNVYTVFLVNMCF